uniref:ATP synthase complex subunit 8 n=1 Tax=Jellisonia amadoi TaxID=1405014 RepID=U5L3K2_JELAM|nr:ATP synthase F0 subunit 8 [Jellisonia amadoi]AGW80398.1 ATP synthase F0 subunit 8 [Jellisonia amadoi]
MPQMAPMYWLILLLIFSIMFMFIILINYFIYTPSNSNYSSTPMKKNHFIWKW